jgi:hypothetical protein
MNVSYKERYRLSVENKGIRIKLNRHDLMPYTEKTMKRSTFQVHTLMISLWENR